MNKGKVSIVVPLFNRKDFIKETVESVEAQTYTNWELIIVDDGSTDGGIEFVQHYFRDDRIYVKKRTASTGGANVCRNEGIKYASGEYIIFLDSDDLLAVQCLEQRVRSMERHPQLDFMVFPMLIFNELVGDRNILWNVVREEDDLSRFLRLDAVWQTTGPIYRKSSLVKFGHCFDDSLPFWQDYDFHVRYLIKQPAYIKVLNVEPDAYCRRHDKGSISQNGFGKDLLMVSGVKLQILDNFQRLLNEKEMLTELNRINLSVNYIRIAEEYFKTKYVRKSYGILFKMLKDGFIPFIDFFFNMFKLPFIVLQLKYPSWSMLQSYERFMKPFVSHKLNFPEYTILKMTGHLSFNKEAQ